MKKDSIFKNNINEIIKSLKEIRDSKNISPKEIQITPNEVLEEWTMFDGSKYEKRALIITILYEKLIQIYKKN